MVGAIYLLTQSDLKVAVNLGGEEYVTVEELAKIVIAISGKKIRIQHVEGPVGVPSRNFSKARSHLLGWDAKVALIEGIARTYAWVEEQVRKSRVELEG
jgi:nucleoside-diphosphate-sugar epimerase